MNFRVFYIALFLIVSPTWVLAQNNDSEFSRDSYGEKMTNKDVIDAKRWHHEGFTEKSLQKLSKVIVSTEISSFSLSTNAFFLLIS